MCKTFEGPFGKRSGYRNTVEVSAVVWSGRTTKRDLWYSEKQRAAQTITSRKYTTPKQENEREEQRLKEGQSTRKGMTTYATTI